MWRAVRFVVDTGTVRSVWSDESAGALDEVQERSWEAILGIRLPIFATTASEDRIVDNQKVRAYLAPLLEFIRGTGAPA